ncbi:hypothetical protein ACQKOE_09455 [Novosphingobium sp. NPDC080210]|uniref:hypothetical protein n=1 Tax=Novosphingobium sp. NPDC080210 TaxID=3390596 RepID=UPI003D0213EF
MLAFATAFVAALLLGLGARDQMLVAGLSLRLGKRLSLLIIALMASALTSALAVWGGETLAPHAPPLLAGLALLLAGLEMILRRPGPVPVEPTRSLGAMGLAFALVQIFDAVRIVLFGLTLAAVLPGAAMFGVVAGALASVGLGWSSGSRLLSFPLLRLRRIAGILLGVGGTLALILR